MPAGRPKKTLKDLPKDWGNKILNAYKQGASDVEVFRGELDISQDLWERFLKEEPEFSVVVSKGKELCKIWWMKTGREGIHDRSMNPKFYEINMMNRFGWGKNVNNDNKTKVELPKFKWSDEEK